MTPRSEEAGDYVPGGGALRMVEVLADAAPARFTEAQWATLSRLKRTGGTWSTYKSRLMQAGLVERVGDYWAASAAAVASYGDPSRAPQSPAETVAAWKQRLGGGAARMIDVLVAAYPLSVSREQLAERVEIAASGGTFGTYLSRLRSNGLCEVAGGTITATSILVESF